MGIELRQLTSLRSLKVGMQTLTGMLDGGDPEESDWGDIPLKIDGASRIVECLPLHRDSRLR